MTPVNNSPTIIYEDNATYVAQVMRRYIKGDKTKLTRLVILERAKWTFSALYYFLLLFDFGSTEFFRLKVFNKTVGTSN